MGWMLQMDSGKKLSRIAIARLGRNSVVMWQFRNYWKIAITMNTLVPFLLGYIAGGNLQYAISSFLFFGLGRALQQQATFCVNSIVHCDIGTNKYYYGSARDIWWMFFLLLGENWHNFHHAFANDYRNGHKWYHADVHKWIIGLMAKIGLATELVVTSELRIQAMSKIVIGRFNRDKNIKIKVAFIEEATRRIQLSAIEKLKTAEKLAHDLRDKLSNVSNNSTYILNYVENLKLSVSTIEENFILELYNSYESLRKSALKLNISAENCLRSIA
jgi:stearoyl-CoA desaturase (delta-9 desaturase)